MNNARNRLAMARQDRDNLSDYSKEYGTLEANKIIGDDHRLDWMEGLEKLRSQNLVIDFRYNIAPQKIYAPQPALDSGNFDIHYSEMKLQFDLLHEGQLLNFFDALRSQINGRYQLEGCTLQRVTSGEDRCGPSRRNEHQGGMQRRLDHAEEPERPNESHENNAQNRPDSRSADDDNVDARRRRRTGAAVFHPGTTRTTRLQLCAGCRSRNNATC